MQTDDLKRLDLFPNFDRAARCGKALAREYQCEVVVRRYFLGGWELLVPANVHRDVLEEDALILDYQIAQEEEQSTGATSYSSNVRYGDSDTFVIHGD